MTEQDAATLANKLLEQYGLTEKGWSFEIEYGNSSMDRLGVCVYDDKTVKVSHWVFTDLNEEIEDTIRHEVAHAICGPGKGHGLTWKMKAKTLGAVPRECCLDGIPQNLRIKIDEARKEREESEKPEPTACSKPPRLDNDLTTYQIPASISRITEEEYVCKQGEVFVCSSGSLRSCILEAIVHCSVRRVQLIVPFHLFKPSEFN